MLSYDIINWLFFRKEQSHKIICCVKENLFSRMNTDLRLPQNVSDKAGNGKDSQHTGLLMYMLFWRKLYCISIKSLHKNYLGITLL